MSTRSSAPRDADLVSAEDDLNQHLEALWLLTNGLGGYALGTALGGPRSRYHGWLVAASNPPVERHLVLHSMVEMVETAGRTQPLNTMEFGAAQTVHPDGWRRMRDRTIELPHTARWRYDVAGCTITRELHLIPGRNAARIRYEIKGMLAQPTTLFLRPLIPLRDFHELTDPGGPDPSCEAQAGRLLHVRRGELGASVRFSRGTWRAAPDHWRNFAYALDRDRGQDWTEDVWSPGVIEVEIPTEDDPARDVEVVVELTEPNLIDLSGTIRKTGRSDSTDPFGSTDDQTSAALARAAEQFIVRRVVDDRWSTTLIAGYPWFADWGRDTMIALPGLLLETGRIDEAAEALHTFAVHRRRGLIPNRFDDYGGPPHYNTVDASLWFCHAVGRLAELIDVPREHPELVQACRDVLVHYERGTDDNIRMDHDGLIAAGSAETQLTWMDAQRDGVTFTPRHGKAVEINALWHRAWLVVAELNQRAGDHDAAQADRTRAGAIADRFRKSFWWDAAGCCHDVLVERDAGRWIGDETIRPNQIFAASLTDSLLSDDQRRRIVQVVAQRLLTPFGLRTLDPHHPDYRGQFRGSLFDRDAAYHQGTVWPWLTGPYVEAVCRTPGLDPTIVDGARVLLDALVSERDRGCFGQIAEVYDGDAPHRRGGCCAQAWSLAALLQGRRLLLDRAAAADASDR